MKNDDNFRVRKDDGDNLGESEKKKKLADTPAPKEVDKESENTPPENEIYVDLEPDELHIADEEAENAKEKKK